MISWRTSLSKLRALISMPSSFVLSFTFLSKNAQIESQNLSLYQKLAFLMAIKKSKQFQGPHWDILLFSLVQDDVEALVLTEKIEVLIPLTWILCFFMAYYGPNSEILGNVRFQGWQYTAVSDIVSYIKNLSILFGIDFLSLVISWIMLWYFCNINIIRALGKLQKDYWMIMAIQHTFLFVEVKIVYIW